MDIQLLLGKEKPMANGLPQLNTGGINIVPGIEAGMRLKSLSQQNFLNQKKIAEYDTERDYLTKKRGWEEEDRTTSLKKLKFQDEKDALTYLYESSPMITYDNYTESKQHLEELGLNPAFLPPKESFGAEGSPEARAVFEQKKSESMINLKDRISLLKAGKKDSPVGKLQDDLDRETNPDRRAELKAEDGMGYNIIERPTKS